MTAPTDSAEPGEQIRRPLRDGIDTVRTQATEVASTAKESASKALEQAREGVGHARESLSDAYASTRERAADAYATAREKAKATTATAREKAKAASKSAGEGIETNPLAALAGGIALGAALGALLPRTKTEAKALGAVGERINAVAREAAAAAKDAGKDKLAELGLTPDKARETMKSLIDGAISAAGSAGTAAADKAKTEATKKG